MKRKTEQKPATNAGEAKETDLDIQEIDLDEAANVTGGTCAACGGVCSAEPTKPPALNQC